MSKTESAFLDIRRLDTLASQDTLVHRMDPRAKVVTTLAFVVTVVSFGKYEVSALFPFVLYPSVLVSVGRLPTGYLLGKLVLVSPFALFVGVFNPLLDREVVLHVGSIGVSGGWVSFASIMMRFFLTVGAALTLLATTGFNSICVALRQLKVPSVLVVQLLLLYRYIFVLAEEAVRMMRAYSLRAVRSTRPPLRVYGSLVGLLLLRALDRAQRIYVAMLCRGFDGEMRLIHPPNFRIVDAVFVLGWCAFFLVARCNNLAQAIGQAAMELVP